MSYDNDRRRGKKTDAILHTLSMPYQVVKGLFHGDSPIKTIHNIADEQVEVVKEVVPEVAEDIKQGANWVAQSVGEISSSFLSGLGITNLFLIVGGIILALFIILKLI